VASWAQEVVPQETGLSRVAADAPSAAQTPSIGTPSSERIAMQPAPLSSLAFSSALTLVGNSAVNTELGLQLNLPLAPGHSVFVGLKQILLGSAIKDGPRAGRHGVSSVRAAYVYRF